MDPKQLVYDVRGACIEVYRNLGPGLLESAYESALEYELKLRGHIVMRQLQLPVVYKGVVIDKAYRADLIVDDSLIIELKAVDSVDSLHHKQLHTYMRLTNLENGLLVNFNTADIFKGMFTWNINQLSEYYKNKRVAEPRTPI